MVDLEKAEKAANRFHKTTTLLASKVSGSPISLSHEYVTLPIILNIGGELQCFYCRSDGHPSGLDDDGYIIPYIVNGAFSLELYLKILRSIESENWPTGHKLHNLYAGLSDDSKLSIQNTVTDRVNSSELLKRLTIGIKDVSGVEFEWNVEQLLENSNMAYQKFRYSFDFEGKLCWFAGYAEIHFAIKDRIKKIRDNKSLETDGDSVELLSP